MKKEENKIFRYSMIVILCIIINVAGKYIAQKFQLPVWLDTIGTCIAVYFTNVFGGIIATVSVSFLWGIAGQASIVYLLAGIALVFLVRICVKKGYLEAFIPAMMSSFGIGLLAAVVSTLIDLIYFEGYSGSVWGDALFDMLKFYGYPKLICAFAGESFINIIDKQISVLAVYAIVRIKWIRKNGYGENRFERRNLVLFGIGIAVISGVIIISCLFLPTREEINVPKEDVAAEDDTFQETEKYINYNEYVKIIYNARNGLPSSEANAIAQTSDGYIWIGGYAGLSRYDGTNFQYITEGGLSNVTAMLTDRLGRLWIGTNDQGIAVYENGSMTFISREDGLISNSIRSLYEDESGLIYAGTTNGLVMIDHDYHINVVEKVSEGVLSVAVFQDYIVGVDSIGNLFCLKNGQLISCEKYKSDDYTYSSVYADSKCIYVGTTGSVLLKVEADNYGIHLKKNINCESLQNITRIQKTGEGVIWISCDNGLGYLNSDGTINALKYSGFDSSIESMIQDYEGNYWFASSRFGVMKLCRNAFTNIYESADKEGVVVNAVTGYKGWLYCGTDNGLQIMNPRTYHFIENKLTDFIGNVRVRCFLVDSRNCLWICCYGDPGLVCVYPDGRIVNYNESKNKTAGDRFRCLLELQDGTIAVGSSGGITFIKDEQVTGTLTKDNGLQTTQILTMVQTPDGTIYAGSDGSGIYVIRDGKLEDMITEEDGLSSPIVLRLTVYEDKCFVVTSNSIEIMRNHTVNRIKSFPYFNNLDIVIHNNDAWVLTSRGIYVVDVEKLASDKFNYTLYDYNNGLMGSITANSWTYIDQKGFLYFCTNDGVKKIEMDRERVFEGNYKIQISSFIADGKLIQEKNGVYTVDSTVDRISITPAICNFLLNDLKVCVYIEGLDRTRIIKRQSQIGTLDYTDIPGGKYTIHIQIFSEMDEKLLQEKTYTIEKKARMWENRYFKVYLWIVMLWEVFSLAWVVNSIRQIDKRKNELEHMKEELENQVKEQTAEIREQSQKMEKMQWGVIEGMASLIESRDGNTGQHVRNTRIYVKLLSSELLRRGMYPDVINEKFVTMITQVAPLHDVGKIKISDVILNKPGKFTPEEFEIMKQHTVMGGEIVADIIGKDADPYMLQLAKEVATYHHEKWDGSGYPIGLAGTDIPMPARIMAIADVFDAIISKRVYKEAMEIEEGFAELERCAGTHFDSELVKVFLEIKPEVIAYCNSIKENR